MMNPPFEIGQRLWLPRSAQTQVVVTCPVCFSQRKVTVILGDGEHVQVDCDGCGLGYEGPQGSVTTYESGARAVEFVISEVVAFRGGRWTFESTGGDRADDDELRGTEADALAVAEMQVTALMEYEMNRRKVPRDELKKLAWIVRYHRDCLREHERKAEYHRSQVMKLSQDKAEGGN
jgi:hypothetical protein